MRFYAVADIHASKIHMNSIRSAVRQYSPDLLIVAGDISQYRTPGSVIQELLKLEIPILAICGNTDLPRASRLLKATPGITGLDGTCVRVNNIPFAGLNGTIPLPFYSLIHIQEKKRLQALPFVDRQTVLVTHPPPRGTLDRVAGGFHVGSPGLKSFILSRQPAMVLCGHIHEDTGCEWIGNTLVVNCAMNRNCHGAMVDYTPGTKPEVRFIPDPGYQVAL